MRNLVLMVLLGVGLMACGGEKKTEAPAEKPAEQQEQAAASQEQAATSASDIGVGPVTHVELSEEVDMELARQGEEIFNQICVACHRMDQRLVGPPLRGVTERRRPEWIMNMILNPEEMIKKDPIAKQLFAEYMTPMTQQNLTEEQARAILEYFRAVDQGLIEPKM